MQGISHSAWLTIDIGNSAIKASLYIADQVQEYATASSLDEILHHLIDWNIQVPFHRIGICSVVPDLTQCFSMQINQFSSAPILTVNSNVLLPIKVNYRPIESLGADRLAAACAGWSITQGQTIIIDAGSAVTIDLVSKSGVFEGGVIMPGPQLSNRAVTDLTANLRPVPLELPTGVLGNSTTEALQHGIIYGMIDAVIGAIERMSRMLKEPSSIILTGGWYHLLSDKISGATVNRNLVLDGIKVLMHHNPVS